MSSPIRFGEETDTLDAEGQVVATSDVRPSRDQIKAALDAFTGEIEQVPPAYSALKIEGKAAYERARAGEEVELKSRKITIFELLLHETTPDSATFHARVSKGTYIRSLARDIARGVEHGRPRHHVEADARRPVRARKGHFTGLSRRSR